MLWKDCTAVTTFSFNLIQVTLDPVELHCCLLSSSLGMIFSGDSCTERAFSTEWKLSTKKPPREQFEDLSTSCWQVKNV